MVKIEWMIADALVAEFTSDPSTYADSSICNSLENVYTCLTYKHNGLKYVDYHLLRVLCVA